MGRPKLCSFIINEWMMMGVLGAYTIRNFTYARLLKKGVFISIVLSYIIMYGESTKIEWTHHKNVCLLLYRQQSISNFRSPRPLIFNYFCIKLNFVLRIHDFNSCFFFNSFSFNHPYRILD